MNSQRAQKHSVFEREVFKEQATCLGRAGKKLQQSIEHYAQQKEKDGKQKSLQTVIANV